MMVVNVNSFDEYTACMRPAPRSSTGRSPAGRPLPPPPCDFNKQSWCAVPGSGYPWHAVRQFVHENQGLMRRMYGEVRQISVLQAELSSNELSSFDVKSTGRADSVDMDLLREAAALKYTAPMATKTKATKVRKGSPKRGDAGKVSETVPKAAEAKAAEIGGKIDEARFKEAAKTQIVHTSTDKGNKIPSTIAELEETIWQSEYSSLEAPTTMAAISSSESFSSSSNRPEGAQFDDSSKKYESDSSAPFETTTMEFMGNAYVDRDTALSKEESVTPEMSYTTTSYSQSNFFSPTVLSSTTVGTVSPHEQSTKAEELHQEKLFQDVVKEEKEGQEDLMHEMMEDEGMLVAANGSIDINEEESQDEELEDGGETSGSEEKEGEDVSDMFPSGSRIPPAKLRGVNACPVKEEVVAPFWANNTRGEILALLNLYPFEQYVHWEKCTYEHRQMFCREGCRCEQQYRLHRLLAYDPRNECRGIFSDWFKFPSCCVCMCYNIPSELRHTSRSPRNQHEEGRTETSPVLEQTNSQEEGSLKEDISTQENAPLQEENLDVENIDFCEVQM
ncbi:hypothetical protein J437_LFUL015165 [Ladona fulva]|uniref:Spaetzle domain-containing protein n=1 Tax=Ladona fulva TaxID=123851 RepID=A0A8K0KID7_LADFU|nr:hypothetical protein J437_LFUL015165 [Ladona fulva]